ncbi:hypothetical protein TNIN_116331 [Trichonephila inaurata madagascariensis]|uniref:Uncharacterized protein n=1 Tax=Trichonephila inaurata madagascariensis TaxID=2747483 RepID=A0A8X6WUL4_9ARAC|nr:hypothetical protein TNIN_116331 [Trichonephila inaurata madagascariensis]
MEEVALKKFLSVASRKFLESAPLFWEAAKAFIRRERRDWEKISLHPLNAPHVSLNIEPFDGLVFIRLLSETYTSTLALRRQETIICYR